MLATGGRARGAGVRAVGGGGASARRRRGVGPMRDVGGDGHRAGLATRRADRSCESRAGTGPQLARAEEHAGAQRLGAKMAATTRTQAGGRASEVGGRAWRWSRRSGGRERPATGGADPAAGRPTSSTERSDVTGTRPRAEKAARRPAQDGANAVPLRSGRPECGALGKSPDWDAAIRSGAGAAVQDLDWEAASCSNTGVAGDARGKTQCRC